MNSIFAAKEYRPFLKTWLEAKDQKRGVLTRLSQAMGCQNSHLTRVLREEVHLTMDQAFEAASFMKFGDSEANYFMKMVEMERASNPNYRNKLKAELKKMKTDFENISKRFEATQLGHLEKEVLYYSSWHWSAIHILTDIPRYRTPAAIAERLNLNEVFVRNCLQTLEEFGLVQREGEQWKIRDIFTHLSKTSPMNSIQHGNWRTRAVTASQDRTRENFHYTMVQTVSEEDFERIKQLLLKTIDDYRQIADRSKSEDLICFTCDFFKV